MFKKNLKSATYFFVVILNVGLFVHPAVGLPNISDGWKFKAGDDLRWIDPSFDDSDWGSIEVGSPWSEQGLADYDGYGWYRLRFTLPANLSANRNFQKFQALVFTLGKLDDADQTWVNGMKVGQTGSFPNEFEGDWTTTREYLVPVSALRLGQENVIAIRLYDHDGDGGAYEGPYEIQVASLKNFIHIDFALGPEKNGIFTSGNSPPFSIRVQNETSYAVVGELSWGIKTDEGELLNSHESSVTLEAGAKRSITSPFTPKKPGFYQVTCRYKTRDEGVVSVSKILGFNPEKIVSALTRKDDFDEFWNNTFSQLAKVEPHFKMTLQEEWKSETHDLYEVEMRSLGDVRVRGWYEKPRKQGLHPVELRVPGYTMNMTPTHTSDPVAVFSFNVRGHGNSQDDVPGLPEDYWLRGLDDKEGYYYQGAYADCVRAVDFLASRPEIDQTRIAISGASQGGGLSLVTAALDQRISFCAPDIPFLCDWVVYFKTSDWPDMNQWIESKDSRTWQTTLETLSYFDAMNMAGKIRCPVFLGLGLQDDVCPPATVFGLYNRLDGPKEHYVYPHAGHWVGAAHDGLKRTWLLKKFGLSQIE